MQIMFEYVFLLRVVVVAYFLCVFTANSFKIRLAFCRLEIDRIDLECYTF